MKSAIFLILFLIASCSTHHANLESNYTVPETMDKDIQDEFSVKNEKKQAKIESTEVVYKIPKKGITKPKKGKIVKSEVDSKEESPIDDELVYKNLQYIYKNDFKNEVLNYTVYGLGLKAGKVRFEVKSNKWVQNREVLHFKAQMNTTSIFNSIYSVNDLVESFVDKEQFYSHRYQLLAAEGDVKKEKLELFNSITGKGYLWKKEEKDGKINESKKNVDIAPFSQDILSSFYYLRVIDFTKNQSFITLNGEQIKKVNLIYKGKEKGRDLIEVSFSDSKVNNAIKIELNDKRIIERVSIPLKIGTIEMLLDH